MFISHLDGENSCAKTSPNSRQMTRNIKMKKAVEGSLMGVTMSKNTRNESSPRYESIESQSVDWLSAFSGGVLKNPQLPRTVQSMVTEAMWLSG